MALNVLCVIQGYAGAEYRYLFIFKIVYHNVHTFPQRLQVGMFTGKVDKAARMTHSARRRALVRPQTSSVF